LFRSFTFLNIRLILSTPRTAIPAAAWLAFFRLPKEEAKYRFVQGKGIRGFSQLGTHLENCIYRGAFACGSGDLRVRPYPIVREAERDDHR
jgi:hypothetical protein